jgi:hypothetical protein
MLDLIIREARDGFDGRRLEAVREWRDEAGVVCAHGYVGAGERWIRWPDLVSFRFDDEGRTEAFPERRLQPEFVREFFSRTVQPLVLQALGWETLHASAVELSGRLVGVCGDCGSGKSTIAYALARRGYRQLADDAVVIRTAPGGIEALDLPFAVRLRPASETFFRARSDAGLGAGRFTSPASTGRPTQLVSALFVITRMREGAPTATRLSPGAAFQALLPHARCFDARDRDVRRRVLENYLAIADRVAVFDLRFADGLEGLPAVLACIERSIE